MNQVSAVSYVFAIAVWAGTLACSRGSGTPDCFADIAPQRLSPAGDVVNGLTLASIEMRGYGSGGRVAAWIASTIEGTELQVTDFDPVTNAWSPVTTLARDVADLELVGDGSELVLAWLETVAFPGQDDETVLAAAHWSGGTWSPRAELGRTSQRVAELQAIARGGEFAVGIACASPGPAVWLFSGDGSRWSGARAFGTLGTWQMQYVLNETARLAMASDGTQLAAAWQILGASSRHGVSVLGSSIWSAPIDPFDALALTTVAGDRPELASDGAGFAMRIGAAVAVQRGGVWGTPRVFAAAGRGALAAGSRYSMVWQPAGSDQLFQSEEAAGSFGPARLLASGMDVTALRAARDASNVVVVWSAGPGAELFAVQGDGVQFLAPQRLDDGRAVPRVLGKVLGNGSSFLASWIEPGDGSPDRLWLRDWVAGTWLVRHEVLGGSVQVPTPAGFEIAAELREATTRVARRTLQSGVLAPEESLPAPAQSELVVPRCRSVRVDVRASGEAHAAWIEDGLAFATPRIFGAARSPAAWSEAGSLTPILSTGVLELDQAMDARGPKIAFSSGSDCVLLQRDTRWSTSTLAQQPAYGARLSAHEGSSLVVWRYVVDAGSTLLRRARAVVVRDATITATAELGDGVTRFAPASSANGHAVAYAVGDELRVSISEGSSFATALVIDDTPGRLRGFAIAGDGERHVVAWAREDRIFLRDLVAGTAGPIESIADETIDADLRIALGPIGVLLAWTTQGVPRVAFLARGRDPVLGWSAASAARIEQIEIAALASGFIAVWLAHDGSEQTVRSRRFETPDWGPVELLATVPRTRPILGLRVSGAEGKYAIAWEQAGEIHGLLKAVTGVLR